MFIVLFYGWVILLLPYIKGNEKETKMNLTRKAQQFAKQYHKSDKSHRAITSDKKSRILVHDKVIGDYYLDCYKVIGKQNIHTGVKTFF